MLVPDVRLPGYGGAALLLTASAGCGGWQDQPEAGLLLDIGLLDPGRHVQQLARPCEVPALERLAAFLLSAASDGLPEQSVPSYQDLRLGLGLSVVQSDALTVEFDVVVADEPGGELLDPDRINFRTSRAAVVAAAQQAADLAERSS